MWFLWLNWGKSTFYPVTAPNDSKYWPIVTSSIQEPAATNCDVTMTDCSRVVPMDAFLTQWCWGQWFNDWKIIFYLFCDPRVSTLGIASYNEYQIHTYTLPKLMSKITGFIELFWWWISNSHHTHTKDTVHNNWFHRIILIINMKFTPTPTPKLLSKINGFTELLWW